MPGAPVSASRMAATHSVARTGKRAGVSTTILNQGRTNWQRGNDRKSPHGKRKSWRRFDGGSIPTATHPCLCHYSLSFPVFPCFSGALAKVIREGDDHQSLYQPDFPVPSPEAPSRASVGPGFPCQLGTCREFLRNSAFSPDSGPETTSLIRDLQANSLRKLTGNFFAIIREDFRRNREPRAQIRNVADIARTHTIWPAHPSPAAPVCG